MCGNNLI